MKIISGSLKGRTIKGFDIDGTRPTMDRVKESLFSSIQDYIPDAVCLDLFSGSGNLGFEAISNGCSHCYFNDISRRALDRTVHRQPLAKLPCHIVRRAYLIDITPPAEYRLAVVPVFG